MHADFSEMIGANKDVVHHDGPMKPVRMPSPSCPAVPSDKNAAYDNTRTPPAPKPNGGRRRVVPHRVGIPNGRRPPNPDRVIIWHVNHLRISRFNHNDFLAALSLGSDI